MSRSTLLGLVALALASCQPKDAGRGATSPEALVRDVEQSKRTPRDERARQYAAALVAMGDTAKARAVLLADYRHGGHLKSLVELAGLERRLGLDGTAAVHETRVATLAPKLLEGRRDVCESFRERARRFDELGDPRAALEDLDRARFACPADFLRSDQMADDRRLRSETTRRIKDLRRQQNARSGPDSALLGEIPNDPRDVRRWSAQHHASLPADRVVRMLAAELRGELGPDIVVPDELRMWVGESMWNDLEAALPTVSPAEAAYARFRLKKVVSEPVEGDPTMIVERRTFTDTSRALEAADQSPLHRAGAWRIFVVEGDLGAAELTLTTAMREGLPEEAARRRRGSGESTPPSDPVHGIAIDHWVASLPVDPDTLANVLILARFRRGAGQEDLALQMTLWAVEQAGRLNLDGIRESALSEARRHLALGRPWHAMAIAEATRSADEAFIRSAAATAIELCRAVDRACGHQQDEDVVARVLGEAWVRDRRQDLLDAALRSVTSEQRFPACMAANAALEADPSTPAGRIFRRSHVADRSRYADDLRKTVESDLALVCGGRLVLPILAAERRTLTAGTLAEMWSHTGDVDSFVQLEIQGQVAMVAGRPRQARLWLRQAAALSPDPARIWRRAADLSRVLGEDDFEIRALREALLHHPRFEGDDLRLRLLATDLRRTQRSWAVGNGDVAAASLRQQVQEYLERGPDLRRWWRREQVAALLGETWVDPTLQELLEPVLWPTPMERLRHPKFHPNPEAVDESSPRSALDLGRSESAVRRGRIDRIPAAIEAFAPVAGLDGLRLALVAHASTADVRFSMASAVAAHGEPASRRAAVDSILEFVERRRAVHRAVSMLLVREPAALPSAQWSLEPALTEPDDLVRIAAGLPLDPPGAKR